MKKYRIFVSGAQKELRGLLLAHSSQPVIRPRMTTTEHLSGIPVGLPVILVEDI